VLPRHFVQTAALCGFPQRVILSMLDELGDTGAGAIDKVLDELPWDFPADIAESISDGAKARLKQIGAFVTAG
jgi:serine/threonine-protein kinase HipA